MESKAKSLLERFFGVEPEERLKILFLSLAFFFVIAGYTLAKDLKDSIFLVVVGKEYQPLAKVLTMFVLVPAIFFYSVLVDKMRRYQLLSFYSIVFGVGGLVFAYFIGDPKIGIANTDSSPYRIFGWLFYFFVEGYSPFVVSVFWAFANSINSPESAKKNYGLMVSASKLGGAISAGCAWALFSWNVRSGGAAISDIALHQVVLAISSGLLIVVPFILGLLIKKVPQEYLHGYEAAYEVEKKKKKNQKEHIGMFAGLKMVLQYPYVLGIFGMVYFYEVVATVIGYLRLDVAQANGSSISEVSSYLFQGYFWTHAVGVVISLVGTRWLLEKLGERICLLLIPLVSGVLLFCFMFNTTQNSLLLAFVLLKSLNYAFSWPVRESLYIPTVKDIKFKSKSWIDAFGSKFAKFSGSTFNMITNSLQSTLFLPAHSFFFASVVSAWFMTAFFLGKRFDQAIAENKVIGADSE